MAGLNEQIADIAAFVEGKKPHILRQKIVAFCVGVVVGATLIISISLYRDYGRTYATYATFYIQEKGGIRPASILLDNVEIKTTTDLEAVESMLMKKYDTHNRIMNIMLFGQPMRLEKK